MAPLIMPKSTVNVKRVKGNNKRVKFYLWVNVVQNMDFMGAHKHTHTRSKSPKLELIS